MKNTDIQALTPTKPSQFPIFKDTYLQNIKNGGHQVTESSLTSYPYSSHHASISCNKHPKRNATFLCIGKDCSQPLFCDSCSFTHSETCFFKEYFNIEMLLDSERQREALKEFKTNKTRPQLSENIDRHLRTLSSGFAQSFEQIRNILFEVDQKCSTERILSVLGDWFEKLILEYEGKSNFHSFNCKVNKEDIIN